jgi:hypothetical protein
MIVDTGKKVLLDMQLTPLAACYWHLFTNNQTISNTTVLTDLTLAAWTGYNFVNVGTLGASAIISHVAVTLPAANPTFTNGSVSPVTFFGWALTDSGRTTLIAAVNIGSTAIPAGGTYTLSSAITDDQK